MLIEIEATPNPATLRFLLPRSLPLFEPIAFERGDDPRPRLAERLLGIVGVRDILLARDFVAVSRTADAPDWPGLQPDVVLALIAGLDEGDDAESRKVLNDSIAYIRSLAQLRGRNAAWAEQAVRGAATLTAGEAAQQHVIDFVAADVPDLLTRADGRWVQVGDRSVALRLRGAAVRDYAPDARTRFLAIITNPTMAYLLLLAGIFGLLLEALHPGAMLPGVTGGICLLVGLYALQLLPVNYAGLALMALGIGLLVAEAVNPTVGAFGVGGVIAFVVGSVMLMHTGVPGYGVNLGVIIGIAVGAALALGLVLRLVLRSRRSRQVTGDQAMLAEFGELLESVGAHGETWVRVRGERWRAHCGTALAAGAIGIEIEPA